MERFLSNFTTITTHQLIIVGLCALAMIFVRITIWYDGKQMTRTANVLRAVVFLILVAVLIGSQ